MTAPFKNVATFFANMKMEKGNCENGKVGERFLFHFQLPVESTTKLIFFLVDERKSSSERRKSEKSQPARVVRVEQELHTHRHTHTYTRQMATGQRQSETHKTEGEGKRKSPPTARKSHWKSVRSQRECCEIQRRRRRRQRRWQRSCD